MGLELGGRGQAGLRGDLGEVRRRCRVLLLALAGRGPLAATDTATGSTATASAARCPGRGRGLGLRCLLRGLRGVLGDSLGGLRGGFRRRRCRRWCSGGRRLRRLRRRRGRRRRVLAPRRPRVGRPALRPAGRLVARAARGVRVGTARDMRIACGGRDLASADGSSPLAEPAAPSCAWPVVALPLDAVSGCFCSPLPALSGAAAVPPAAFWDCFSCAPWSLSPAARVFCSSLAAVSFSAPPPSELPGASCTVFCAATGPAFGSSPLFGSFDGAPGPGRDAASRPASGPPRRLSPGPPSVSTDGSGSVGAAASGSSGSSSAASSSASSASRSACTLSALVTGGAGNDGTDCPPEEVGSSRSAVGTPDTSGSCSGRKSSGWSLTSQALFSTPPRSTSDSLPEPNGSSSAVSSGPSRSWLRTPSSLLVLPGSSVSLPAAVAGPAGLSLPPLSSCFGF
ncbi:hypothetical protein STAFG_7287 [Streptomyces afghaniensis 772]|uniref:Uncharacterized protein n=1 Tax=Streptomyces afghaniensis 772 TaxID=1283301 RepID=S4MGL0_9ACTN|nr:hypothetical protein STAFG_7287 [Streptomyces afghaniensis 772]